MSSSSCALSNLLSSLSECISDVDKSLEVLFALRLDVITFESDLDLLETYIYSFDWHLLCESQVESWKEFLVDIVTAYPSFTFVCLNSIISGKTSDLSYEASLIANNSRSYVISSIFQVSPDSLNFIVQCIRQNIPHHFRSENSLINFYSGILTLSEHLPMCREEVWALIIEGLVRMDSEVPRSFLDQYRDHLEEIKHKKMTISQFLEKFRSNCIPSLNTWILLSKLDRIMSMLMQYFDQSQFKDDSQSDFPKIISRIFVKCVLPAYGLIAVPFLWFHMASTNQMVMEKIVSVFWNVFKDPSQSQHERQMSIFYLSGLISRSSNFELSFCKQVIQEMSNWCMNYRITSVRSTSIAASVVVNKQIKHLLFYSIFQSLMYSLVYISHSLILKGCPTTLNNWCKFVSSLQLQPIIFSTGLNPLAFCDQKVVSVFAQTMSQLQIFYCYTVMQKNKRIVSLLRSRSSSNDEVRDYSSRSGEVSLSDYCYYPYDPLLLPVSSLLIEPFYLYWKDTTSINNPNSTKSSESSTRDDTTGPITYEKAIQMQMDEFNNSEENQLAMMERLILLDA